MGYTFSTYGWNPVTTWVHRVFVGKHLRWKQQCFHVWSCKSPRQKGHVGKRGRKIKKSMKISMSHSQGNGLRTHMINDEIRYPDNSEEFIEPKEPTAPPAPTTAEWIEHQITHMPYKSWCPICMCQKIKIRKLIPKVPLQCVLFDEFFYWLLANFVPWE